MELIEVNPALIVTLGALVMVIMQAIKWANLVNDNTSVAAQRILVAVLAGGAALAANYTAFLNLDFSEPLQAVLNLAQMVAALWLVATGAYHALYNYLNPTKV
jgi:hypothetical protein